MPVLIRWGVAAAFITTVALSQDPVASFSSTTRLVELSVSVTSAKGEAVVGLTKDDFTVTAAGQVRPIASVQFDGSSGASSDLARLPAHVFTNRSDFTDGTARNVTAIVIDTANSTPADSIRLQANLLSYLRRVPGDSRIALYQFDGSLRILHDFTQDQDVLRSRIRSVATHRPSGAEQDVAALRASARSLATAFANNSCAFQSQLERMLFAEMEQADRERATRIEQTMAAMISLSRHLASVAGRKNLIWAGGGIPLLQVKGSLAAGGHNNVRSFGDWIQTTARRLSEANVVLYYYDTRGVMVMSGPAGGASAFTQGGTQATRISEDARLGTTLLTSLTGGIYVNYSNDVAEALEQAEADQRSSYTLAFYAQEMADRDWVPVSLRVNRPGVKLRYRAGYRLSASPPPGWDDKARDLALVNPFVHRAILLNARCERDPESKVGGLRLFVQVDAGTVAFRTAGGKRSGSLELAVAEFNAGGTVYPYSESAVLSIPDSDWPRILREGIPYLRRWKARPESVRIRVLVRDAISGQLGSLDMPLKDVLRLASR